MENSPRRVHTLSILSGIIGDNSSRFDSSDNLTRKAAFDRNEISSIVNAKKKKKENWKQGEKRRGKKVEGLVFVQFANISVFPARDFHRFENSAKF